MATGRRNKEMKINRTVMFLRNSTVFPCPAVAGCGFLFFAFIFYYTSCSVLFPACRQAGVSFCG
jgi:hypothetical protein